MRSNTGGQTAGAATTRPPVFCSASRAFPQSSLAQRITTVSFSTAHPECERSERIEGAVSLDTRGPGRPLDTLAALALGVSGVGMGPLEANVPGFEAKPPSRPPPRSARESPSKHWRSAARAGTRGFGLFVRPRGRRRLLVRCGRFEARCRRENLFLSPVPREPDGQCSSRCVPPQHPAVVEMRRVVTPRHRPRHRRASRRLRTWASEQCQRIVPWREGWHVERGRRFR